MPALLPPETCKVYTPHGLASAMVRALGIERGHKWLEPAVGRGVFLDVLNSNGIAPSDIVAIDLDTARYPSHLQARVFRGIDFLKWSSTTLERFDRIVGNPPYIPLTRVHSSIRRIAIQNLALDGNRSGTANTWAAFLSCSLNLLSEGGSMAFVLPSSWDYADYAEGIRKQIYRSFRSVEVYRSLRPLFTEVKEGSVVLVCREFGAPTRDVIRREYEDGDALVAALKKRTIGKTLSVGNQTKSSERKTVRFRDLFDLRIGAVTGDSRFFLLDQTHAKQHRLPREALTPILTKSRQLKWASITNSRYKSLVKEDERIWLFRPTHEVLHVRSVRKYLALDPKVGGCNRAAFKVSQREKWHQVALVPQAAAFLSGMSKVGPWICINRCGELTASNTLYVLQAKKPLGPQKLAAWAISFLSSFSRNQLNDRGRRYAQGLLKYEPSDIADVMLIVPKKFRGALAVYEKCIEMLTSRTPERGVAAADEWLELN